MRAARSSLSEGECRFVALLPIEPETEDVLGNQFLIPHIVEYRIDTVHGNGWIGQTENTWKDGRTSMEPLPSSSAFPTVEFSGDENDAGLFDGFSETLILNFSLTDLATRRRKSVGSNRDLLLSRCPH